MANSGQQKRPLRFPKSQNYASLQDYTPTVHSHTTGALIRHGSLNCRSLLLLCCARSCRNSFSVTMEPGVQQKAGTRCTGIIAVPGGQGHRHSTGSLRWDAPTRRAAFFHAVEARLDAVESLVQARDLALDVILGCFSAGKLAWRAGGLPHHHTRGRVRATRKLINLGSNSRPRPHLQGHEAHLLSHAAHEPPADVQARRLGVRCGGQRAVDDQWVRRALHVRGARPQLQQPALTATRRALHWGQVVRLDFLSLINNYLFSCSPTFLYLLSILCPRARRGRVSRKRWSTPPVASRPAPSPIF